MSGLIIYTKKEAARNKRYIDWVINAAKSQGLELTLVLKEDIEKNGFNSLITVEFAINRTRDYNISLILELQGVRVFNNSLITLIGNNKLAGYRYIKGLGVKFPKIFGDYREKDKFLSKPICESGGQGIKLSEGGDNLKITQELVENVYGDIRFYIIGNKIRHCIRRYSSDLIAVNYSLGGEFEKYNYSDELKDLVELILSQIKIDYGSVDLLVTKSGEVYFNEIEDVVGSRMLSELGINDTTKEYIKYIKGELRKWEQRQRAYSTM